MAQEPAGYQIGNSYHNDVSPALRDMPPWPVQANQQQQEAAENPFIFTAHQDVPDLVVDKGNLLSQLAPSIPAPMLTFPGIPYPGVGCFCVPPDTNGEVGATQYVQIVNKAYQVFSKTTGSSILGPNDIQSIWSGFGGVCQTNGSGDPVVLYDQIASRWIISQFAGSSYPTDECVAVSTTSDATGTWYRYGFHISSNFIDYPKLSVWPDAYYMSINVFNSTGTSYLGPQAVAFDRAKMIAGTPATFIAMSILGPTFPPMLPSDLDGWNLPALNAPNSYVLWPNTNTYRVYHFKVGVPFGTSPTFTLFASPAAAGFTQLCPGNRNCVAQLGASSTNNLDAIGDRLMFRLDYRNFGDHESLVGNFTVSSGGVAGIRWFELRNVTSGPVTVFQESTYQPDTTWRWMGSIAMNGQGNMALAYSASSATIHPQIRYAGRLSTDALNTLALGEAHFWDGAGAQINSGNRWGDYSDLTVDPVDDATFWYTNEYYDTVSSFNWKTRIGKFQLVAPYTIYTSQVPGTTVFASNYETATQFTASLSGHITKLRFWQAQQETGSHNLHLWTDTGTLLATGTIAAGGGVNQWQEVAIPSVAVSAGVKYRVSYNVNTQDSKTFFAGYPITNGPLSASLGYYAQPAGVFPTISTTSWTFADVVFSQ